MSKDGIVTGHPARTEWSTYVTGLLYPGHISSSGRYTHPSFIHPTFIFDEAYHMWYWGNEYYTRPYMTSESLVELIEKCIRFYNENIGPRSL